MALAIANAGADVVLAGRDESSLQKTAEDIEQLHRSADIIVANLVRHTHRWGTDFTVWYAGGAKDGELIFTSADYEDTEYLYLSTGGGWRIPQ